MKLADVENLSAAELKEQRAAIVESLEADAAELKARYVQARLDAKQRDEKLAEQGKTITLLQESLESTKAALESEVSKCNAIGGELQRVCDNHNHQASQWSAELRQLKEQFERQELEWAVDKAKLQGELKIAKDRGDRLYLQAIRNANAINTAAKLLNDALAAQQIDNAEQG